MVMKIVIDAHFVVAIIQASSSGDFLMKMNIALKEASETKTLN